MKDILIIAHFTQLPGEPGNGRFNYIAERINKKNANVEVITTSFSHSTKAQRNISDDKKKGISYKLTMLYEPGYKKNVSLKRLYSHYIIGRNLKKYLSNRKRPDLIYCAVPSLDLAKVAAKYAKENNIRFIIDIQDLWPEAFMMVLNIPTLSNIIFSPLKRQADYIYESADEVVAVSETYSNRALDLNSKVKNGKVVFLGTDLRAFDEAFIKNKYQYKPEKEIWIAYVGTLGNSYDLPCVFDALEILKFKGYNNLKFIIMGDGPLKEKFEEYAKEKGIDTLFTGRLAYVEMVGLLGVCDIAVNPIKFGSAGSIINKVGDYAAAGLPVINTQECLEYRNLLDEYKAGLNCKNGDVVDLANKLLLLINDPFSREKMGKNNHKLAEDRFDRTKTYKEILSLFK